MYLLIGLIVLFRSWNFTLGIFLYLVKYKEQLNMLQKKLSEMPPLTILPFLNSPYCFCSKCSSACTQNSFLLFSTLLPFGHHYTFQVFWFVYFFLGDLLLPPPQFWIISYLFSLLFVLVLSIVFPSVTTCRTLIVSNL